MSLATQPITCTDGRNIFEKKYLPQTQRHSILRQRQTDKKWKKDGKENEEGQKGFTKCKIRRNKVHRERSKHRNYGAQCGRQTETNEHE